jgi:DNA-binding TFAR19-related protein (PDSD5 family)
VSVVLRLRRNRSAVHRVSLVKPEKAREIENSILQRAQRGLLGEKVSEDTVIQMLQAGNSGQQGKASSVTFKRRNLDDDDEW